MRIWFRKKWAQLKGWFVGVLVALGLVTAPFIMAEPKDFTYTAATQYEDGTALPIEEIATTQVYCRQGADPFAEVVQEVGADGVFDPVEFTGGDWECYATHTATNGQESQPSGSVFFRILPDVAPNPPVLSVN